MRVLANLLKNALCCPVWHYELFMILRSCHSKPAFLASFGIATSHQPPTNPRDAV
jgi:hypothetical protein